jgi:acetyl-CoA acetyltransferase
MNVHILGVGMIPFTKPGNSTDFPLMGEQAARLALEDAGIGYQDMNQGFVGYVYSDSAAGQSALYGLGMTGIPIINVNNNCASGSTAFFLAVQAVRAGADCVIALGVEQMIPGALDAVFADRPNPLKRFGDAYLRIDTFNPVMPAVVQFDGSVAREYLRKYQIPASFLAEVAVKARRHGALNPYAVFRNPTSVEAVMASPVISSPLTRLQCCPPTCGAAAVIVCSESFAHARSDARSIKVAACQMKTDFVGTFDSGRADYLMGVECTRIASEKAYSEAGISAADLDVVELHDSFTINEIVFSEALGLAAEGEAIDFFRSGANTHGGRCVVNPSGGLLSRGHPLGATGIAQIVELVWQLRGDAKDRQVPHAEIALAHNHGLGGAAVVSVLTR